MFCLCTRLFSCEVQAPLHQCDLPCTFPDDLCNLVVSFPSNLVKMKFALKTDEGELARNANNRPRARTITCRTPGRPGTRLSARLRLAATAFAGAAAQAISAIRESCRAWKVTCQSHIMNAGLKFLS